MTAGGVASAARHGDLGPRPGQSFLVGLIGRGIQLSRTPAMQESAGSGRGLRLVYRLLDPDMMGDPAPDLATVLRAAEICGFAGVNVTYPFKREILPLLDELSAAASRIGAVNTVVFRGGRRFGHNTDCWGFAESFRRGMAEVERSTALLLGAGGAGVAVGHALLDCGIGKVLVHDIDGASADALVESLSSRVDGTGRAERVSSLREAVSFADGIVNASPVGMAKLPGVPIPLEFITSRHWVADVVYFPLETPLLAGARAKGCRVLAGSGMALFQAVRAFELFTGAEPDVEAMQETFESFVA